MEDGNDPAEPTADDQLQAYEAVRILGEYVPRGLDDDTSQVLRAFVDCLPVEGQWNMVEDIFAYGNDIHQLHKLRDLVVDAVLKRSEFPLSQRPFLRTRMYAYHAMVLKLGGVSENGPGPW